MAKREKLEGLVFKDFTAEKYIGNKKYLMKCNICGEVKELYATNIKKGQGVTCSKKKIHLDLTGMKFGDWTVLKYVGNKKYLCMCSCENHTIREVRACNLVNGSSTSCGHAVNHYGDLTGQRFGDWLVIEKVGYKYKCQCQCDKGTIRYISSHDLCTGKTKSCGHGYNEFTDITGQKFGLWIVIEYLGNQYYLCECQCDKKTRKPVRKADLLRGTSTSCGCNKGTKAKQTLKMRYGEIGPNKVHNPRTLEQVEAVESRENLEKFIHSLGNKVSSVELSKALGLGRTLNTLKAYRLLEMVEINPHHSQLEKDVIQYIKTIYNKELLVGNRDILGGKELDIYIPELKIAIEVNGDYWHSSLLKDKYYHMNKSIECINKGIQLIHIFEHEWYNKETQFKIKNLLKEKISPDTSYFNLGEIDIQELPIKDAIREIRDRSLSEQIGNINIAVIDKSTNTTVKIISIEGNKIIQDIKLKPLSIQDENRIIDKVAQKYNLKSLELDMNITKGINENYLKMDFKPVLGENKHPEVGYKWLNTQTHEYIKDKEVADMGMTDDELYIFNIIRIYDAGQLKLIKHIN